MLYTRQQKGGNTLDSHVYQTGQFAKRASVSERTLRFYDKVGLLSPARYSDAGYRLYTDADFFRLQQILALKFLGFSLDEIRGCLRIGLGRLQESLALQKAMMRERRAQLDSIIEAIDETEKLLHTNVDDWEAIVRVIRVMHMQQTNDWRRKYFTEEQLQQMEELNKKYYTEEQRQKLAEWGQDWSEENQRVATEQWAAVQAELKRLVATGQDPAGPEAQALAKQWQALISSFTHGDTGIAQGLKNMYTDISQMPAGEAPYAMPYTPEEGAYLQKAFAALRQS